MEEKFYEWNCWIRECADFKCQYISLNIPSNKPTETPTDRQCWKGPILPSFPPFFICLMPTHAFGVVSSRMSPRTSPPAQHSQQGSFPPWGDSCQSPHVCLHTVLFTKDCKPLFTHLFPTLDCELFEGRTKLYSSLAGPGPTHHGRKVNKYLLN